jgi:ABC-type polysaccharide/polyol phosphate transport system ATPase subunit
MAKIILDNINVEFPIYGQQNLFRRAFINKLTRGRIFKDEMQIKVVKALQNISFTLQKGDRLGLVGTNGAGKSTLLKTLGQLYRPASGYISIEGKISTLFDVCMGMDLERTGYHNIYYMGMLLGIPRVQIKKMIPDIEDFSELGSFLNMPVRTYSAGMKVRLGFAICTCIDPTILLLDEAIGAGDAHFIEKASQRAKELYDKAEIIVIASHSEVLMKEFCNKALWLHKGRMVMFGGVDEVLHAYEAEVALRDDETEVEMV